MRTVANIAGYHGLKGEIKFFPLVDDNSFFQPGLQLEIDSKSYEILACRPHKKFILIKLKDHPDLTSVESIKGEVKADAEDLLDDGEHFIDDLIGLQAFNEDESKLGEVVNFSTKPTQILFVKLDPGYNAKRDLMVPFVDEYLRGIDLEDGSIVLSIPDDLLDLAK